MPKEYLRFKIGMPQAGNHPIARKPGRWKFFTFPPSRTFRQLYPFTTNLALQHYIITRVKTTFFLFISLFSVQPIFCQPVFKGLRENLGKEINDAQDQLQPVFSTDGNTLYFSNGSGANQSPEIWCSLTDSAGHLVGKQKVPAMNAGLPQPKYMLQALSSHQYLLSGVYTKYSGSLQYSRGMSVFDSKKSNTAFSMDNFKKTSSSTLDSVFRKQQVLPFYHPFSMVYLWSQKNGDQLDLYALLNEHATDKGKPQLIKLPAPLNTAYNETTPWMDDEGRFLYFASDRPGGLGQLDLYVSERLDGSWQKWSVPKNLGPAVNSNKNDIDFIIDPNETYGYLASDKNGFGNYDLFRIRLGEGDTARSAGNLLLPTDRPDTSLLLQPNTHAATNITFLLDVSNSMAQDRKMVLLKKSLYQLVQQLRPSDRVSIVVFGSGVEVLLGGQTVKNRADILDAIRSLSANGCATNIGAGLGRAYQQALQFYISKGNNQLYLVTDGVFILKPADNRLVLSNPNIQLTTVIVGNDPETSKAIAPLVQKINGRLLRISGLQTNLNILLQDVRSQAALYH